MPTYPHFKTRTLDPAVTTARIRAQKVLGVPYTDEDLALAEQRYLSQAQLIADDLLSKDVEIDPMSEMVAMIAYLQRLGRGPQPLAPAPVTTANAAGGR
jgi:cytochrome c oxidase cbb3-type subunit I/II